MRCFQFIFILGLLALTACNSAKKADDANFTKAINVYLTNHGAACTVIGRQFPIDLPQSEQIEHFGIEPKLADDSGGPRDARSPARFNSAATCEAIRAHSEWQEVFPTDSRLSWKDRRFLLRAEERRFHRQMDGTGDDGNIFSDRGHLHIQDRRPCRLGRAP